MAWPHAGFRPPGPLFGDPAGDTAAGTYGASEPITIYTQGTTTKATIYVDTNRSATAANPVVTDAVGNLSYFTDPAYVDEVAPDGVRTTNVVNPNPIDLAASAGLGIVPMAPWQPATPYTAGMVVTFNGQTWGCVTPHTSGATFSAGEQANWTLMAAGGVGSSPSGSVTGPDSFGASSTAGAATTFSRGDHDHGLPADPRGSPLGGTGLTGATQATRFVGGTTSGPPVSGTFATGDYVIDRSGTIQVCTAGGTPGTWLAPGADSLVVHLAGIEVITGAKTFSGGATVTGGLTADVTAITGLTGATASSRYVGATASGAPVSGTFNTGDWVVDTSGAFWVCTAGGTPGTWATIPTNATVVHITGAESIAGAKTFSDPTSFLSAISGLSATWSGTDNAQAFAASGLPGATAASRNVGATASGAPSTGTFAVGDWIVDQTGAFWVCTVSGTPGTWVKTGAAVSISPATTVTGPVAYGAAPVVGTSANYSREDHGHGNLANPTGLPLALTGATVATRYVGGTTSGAPASGTFAVGDFVIDQSGAVWICTAAGTPGTWVNGSQPKGTILARKLYGPSSLSTYNITGQTLVAVDTTNLTTPSFTVPPSGAVKFVVQMTVEQSSSGSAINMLCIGAMNHSGGAQLGAVQRAARLNNNNASTVLIDSLVRIAIPITGLTVGAALQIDLGALQVTAGQTASIYAQDGVGATHTIGPALLEVVVL